MKIIRCIQCKCIINTKAGYYSFPSGAQCQKCGEEKAKILDRDMKKDPFGLQLLSRINRLKNNGC